jgi:hypothetical protein
MPCAQLDQHDRGSSIVTAGMKDLWTGTIVCKSIQKVCIGHLRKCHIEFRSNEICFNDVTRFKHELKLLNVSRADSYKINVSQCMRDLHRDRDIGELIRTPRKVKERFCNVKVIWKETLQLLDVLNRSLEKGFDSVLLQHPKLTDSIHIVLEISYSLSHLFIALKMNLAKINRILKFSVNFMIQL